MFSFLSQNCFTARIGESRRNKNTSILAVGLLSICLLSVVIGTMFAGSVAAQTSTQVDVNVTNLPGSGTSADPYKITNASELQAIEDEPTASYELQSDIDASGTEAWNNGQGFKPVHDSEFTPFTGTFNGNSHSISGIYVNRPIDNRVGLFARIGSGAEIRNVTVTNATITGSNNVGAVVGQNGAFGAGTVKNVRVTDTSVKGDKNVGGVVGLNENVGSSDGVVRDTLVDGNVTGTTNIGGVVGNNSGNITLSAAGAVVSATGQYSGGLVGTNRVDGLVSTSSAVSGVSGNQSGGLIGFNDGTVTQSFATGTATGSTYVGGLAGYNAGTITDTYARTTVNGSEASAIGGLVGAHFGGWVNTSYSTGDVTALNGSTDSVGGFIGDNTSAIFTQGSVKDSYYSTTTQSGSSEDITELQPAQMTGDAAKTNMTGFSFGSVWATRSGGFPALAWETVEIVNPTLTPSTIDSSLDQHTLRFDVLNVSADGQPDNLNVTLPDSVGDQPNSASASYTDSTNSVPVGQTNITNNGVTFAVNPDDEVANRDLTVEVTLELNATQ